MIMALGAGQGWSVIASKVTPCPEENVSVSSDASSTSENLLSA
jgi:hypothetical protein